MDSPPPDELAERGRAIFDRLRGGDEPADSPAEWLPEQDASIPAAVALDDEPPEAVLPDKSEVDDPVDLVVEVHADAGETAPESVVTDRPAESSPDGAPESVAEAVQAAAAAEVGANHPESADGGDVPSATGLVDEASDDTDTPGGAPTTAPAAVRRERPTPIGAAHPVATSEPNPFVRPLPRVLAIANQKGGVGKTTTAVNLGAALAELGYKVLVVDLDPQGNATTGLGINARNLQASIYDVIMNEVSLEDCIEPTSLRNLYVAPATIDLAGAEIELVPAFSRELKLRRALDELEGEYDYSLIDCPPSLGLLTVNGLAAATEVVVPIQCEYYALEGLSQLMKNVGLVKTNLNPRLEVSAFILTMYDARTKLADQVAQEVRNHFGGRVCRNIVPRTVRLSEAPSFGQPVIVFDPSSRGAIAYRELAREVSGGTPQRVG